MIRRIASESEIEESAAVVRAAFAGIATEFGLTQTNCPSHPAFLTADALRAMRDRGSTMFGLFEGERQVGFVAVEKASEAVHCVEKLAVLPEHRHAGYGRRLMEFASEHVRAAGGRTVSIGIVNENRVLKDWYLSLGFRETGAKRFPHLPFEVCFMEKSDI
jgi:GNAT superfamily N-acetyltransferase